MKHKIDGDNLIINNRVKIIPYRDSTDPLMIYKDGILLNKLPNIQSFKVKNEDGNIEEISSEELAEYGLNIGLFKKITQKELKQAQEKIESMIQEQDLLMYELEELVSYQNRPGYDDILKAIVTQNFEINKDTPTQLKKYIKYYSYNKYVVNYCMYTSSYLTQKEKLEEEYNIKSSDTDKILRQSGSIQDMKTMTVTENEKYKLYGYREGNLNSFAGILVITNKEFKDENVEELIRLADAKYYMENEYFKRNIVPISFKI